MKELHQTNVFIDRLAEAPWMRMPSQRIGEFQHSPRLDDKNLRILIAAGILPVASFDGRLVKRTTSALRWFGAAAAALIVMGTVAHSVRATITVSGNASPVYNSTDPWATTTLIVGNTAPGSMAVGAGSVVNNTGTGTVANIAAASTSAVSISGAGSKWTNTGEVHVGQSGAATLDITSGGAVTNTMGKIAVNSGSNSIVNVGGGTGTSTWTNSSDLYVGNSGTGTLNVTGGGSVSSAGVLLGFNSTGNGTVNVGGGTGTSTWKNTGSMTVGYTGPGTLNVTGGGNFTATSSFTVGTRFSTALNHVTVGGGSGTATMNLFDLDLYYGIVDITGGAVVNPGVVDIAVGGLSGGGTGTLNIGGGTGPAKLSTSSMDIGGYGHGELHITDGGTVESGNDYIAEFSGSGIATVDGPGASWSHTAELRVGLNGLGTLTVSNGATVSDKWGYVGSSGGNVGSGVATVGGGTGTSTWSNSVSLNVVQGTLTINTDGLVVAPALDGGNVNSIINFNGGTLRITGTDSASDKIALLSGGGTIDVPNAGTKFTITNAITGAGSLTKTGASVLALSGANTYSGGTTISGGTLLANNTTGSATGSGSITIAAGATLGGTGTVTGSVTVNGSLSPGASIESLDAGAVTFNSGSNFNYEFNSSTVTADLLNSSGSLSIATAGAGVSLVLTDLGGASLATGTKFPLIRYNGAWDGGTFVGAPNFGLVNVGSNTFQIRYDDTTPGGNLNLVGSFVTLMAVPEPSGLISLGFACCFAVCWPCFRRRHQI
jgi:T5SS/PEP-CTERM-associated repeat protein